MQFIGKTEFYVFVFAALTMSLIYYVAFDKNVASIGGAIRGGFQQIMGQTPAGVFQKPF